MTLSWREAASRSKSSPEREKGERAIGVMGLKKNKHKKNREEQGQIGVKEGGECRACTQVDRKQSREGCIQTARSWKGEWEPANTGTNNEDKTRDGRMLGLQMKAGGKNWAGKQRGEGRVRKRTEETKGNSYLLTITREKTILMYVYVLNGQH